MNDLVSGDLRIDARAEKVSAPIQLLWRGKSVGRNPSRTLAPYFSGVLAEAETRHVPLELHFEKLEYFNSSTITSIIQLVQDARTRGVHMVIHYDGGLSWQRMSFEPLRVFANELLELRSC
jgi:hypothetical protein